MKLYAYLLLLVALVFGVIYCYRNISKSTTGTLTVYNDDPIELMTNDPPLLIGTTTDPGNGVNCFVVRVSGEKHAVFTLGWSGKASLYGVNGRLVALMEGTNVVLWSPRADVKDRIYKTRRQLRIAPSSVKDHGALYSWAIRSLDMIEHAIAEINFEFKGDVIR